MKKLGKLEKITDLRDVWPTEAGDFTPWLAEENNISLLSEAINIDLEVEAQEQFVGPFCADILCKDTVDNSWVLIENQLEKTDHLHLGQLLTYAAGLEAVTIVWIAQTFTEEHRAAIDWLNERTDENINFFGLEIELWKIDDSDIAPKFNVVSKPNSWSRTIKNEAEKTNQTGIKVLQHDYWTTFKEFMERSGSFVRCQKPQYQHWTNFAIGRAYFYICARMNTREEELGVHLVINGSDREGYFKLLEKKYKSQIEQQMNMKLIWRLLPEAKENQIVVPPLKADPKNRDDWSRQHEWLKTMIENLHRVLSPIIRNLEIDDLGNNEAVTE
ncbi:MAG: DUF4268 domain-containing protein [Sedimentisphaerales bacterium]|nr:DUF4268 domain-containing protein [Sedimentisphaerales bacterium]